MPLIFIIGGLIGIVLSYFVSSPLKYVGFGISTFSILMGFYFIFKPVSYTKKTQKNKGRK